MLWPSSVVRGLTGIEVTTHTGNLEALVGSLGLRQVSDSAELERIVDAVLAGNAKSVDEYRAGKQKAFNALVGQAMKASQGKANPEAVGALLKQRLG